MTEVPGRPTTPAGPTPTGAAPGAAPGDAVPSEGAAPAPAAGPPAAGPTDAGRLVADVRVERGTFTLQVAIDVRPGQIVAVLGPNGAGKSTLLAALAGLLVPTDGTITLGGRTLTGPGVLVPPERRRVGLMGQDPLLFPHLSAVDNIAFGPRSQGSGRAAASAAARDWLRRLDLAAFATQRPAALSGGQRQRVALARALAAGPELLLLDEPLGALDAQTAPEIRHVLRTHLRATTTTTVLVTHDVLDAATLADRVVVLDHGSVIDSGETATVLAQPRSEFSAAIAGLNLLAAAADESVAADRPATAGRSGIGVSGIAAEPLAAGDPVAVVFPPSAVAVYLEHTAAGSPRNTWAATVVALEPGPASIRIRARLDGAAADPPTVVAADVTPASVAQLGLRPGTRVFLSVKATEVRLHRGR